MENSLPGRSGTDRNFSLVWALLCVLLAGALYLRMLGAAYIWDDGIFQQVQMPYIRSVTDAFFPPQHLEYFTRLYYRPMILLSSLLDRVLASQSDGGISPAWSHGANLLYHMIVTGLVFLLVYSLFRHYPRRLLAAAAAAVIFAVHPIHAEVVCSVTGRSDLLATLFVLAAVLAARSAKNRARGWAWLALSALCLFCGLLSKETAIAAVVLIPTVLRCFPERDRVPPYPSGLVKNVLLAALLLAALGGYAILRATAGSGYGHASSLQLGEGSLRLLSALGFYVRKIVVPWPQLHYVARLPDLSTSAASLVVAGIAIVWIFAVARAGRAAVLFAVVWFFSTLAPALAVVLRPLAVTQVAERYLYLPSVAVCLGVGQWIVSADFRRIGHRIAAVGVVGIVLAYAASVVERTDVWQDNLHFWTDALRDPAAAESPVVLGNLAGELLRAGRSDQARVLLMKAYDNFQDPMDRWRVLTNLAAIDLFEAETNLAQGNAARAKTKADEIIVNLQAPLSSVMKWEKGPNAFMGYALTVKAQAEAQMTGKMDAALLKRAIEHFDIAQRGQLQQDPSVQASRALCVQLLATVRSP